MLVVNAHQKWPEIIQHFLHFNSKHHHIGKTFILCYTRTPYFSKSLISYATTDHTPASLMLNGEQCHPSAIVLYSRGTCQASKTDCTA